MSTPWGKKKKTWEVMRKESHPWLPARNYLKDGQNHLKQKTLCREICLLNLGLVSSLLLTSVAKDYYFTVTDAGLIFAFNNTLVSTSLNMLVVYYAPHPLTDTSSILKYYSLNNLLFRRIQRNCGQRAVSKQRHSGGTQQDGSWGRRSGKPLHTESHPHKSQESQERPQELVLLQ